MISSRHWHIVFSQENDSLKNFHLWLQLTEKTASWEEMTLEGHGKYRPLSAFYTICVLKIVHDYVIAVGHHFHT